MSLCIVINNSLLQVPPHCIPIHANVTTYDWGPLVEACQFDVIMMDPPWQLATANPTRGVALGYSQLTDADIQALPIGRLQSNGFLFIWVINTKYHFTLDLLDRWGYRSAGRVSIRGNDGEPCRLPSDVPLCTGQFMLVHRQSQAG